MDNGKVNVEIVPVESLQPDPQNANQGTERGLRVLDDSLRELGAGRSVLVDKHGVLIAGNKTHQRAVELGFEDAIIVHTNGKQLVVVQRDDLDLKDSNAKKLAVTDNRAGELGLDWNPEVLASLLQEDEAILKGLFEKDELAELLKGLEGEQKEDPGAAMDKAEELQEKWRVQKGQLWQIGKHRLLCGDSTSAEDVGRLMGEENGQMAITSPPYGVGKSYETKGIGPWFETIRPVIGNICKHVGIVVWQIADLYSTGGQFIEPTLAYSINMFTEVGFKPLWLRVWEKPGSNHGVGPYHLVTNKPVQQYEHIAAFGEDAIEETDYAWISAFGNSKYRFTGRLTREDKKAWGYSGVWKINPVQANDVHVAMFPLELPIRAIKMHSDEGQIVLDPFLGSGTTMVAAEQTGRICRGMELEPKYCAVILERMTGMGLDARLLEV